MTPKQLQAAVLCTPDRAELFAPFIAEAFVAYGINTAARQAAFLAQIGHESGSFRYTREIWGPTPAQARYEGRQDLGNLIEGDGRRFCGHGLIQVTGRFNHRAAMINLRRVFGPTVPDFELDPEQLAQPRWAALSAGDYWNRHKCDALADAGNFEGLTRAINGGLNGLADRITRWEKAKAALGVGATPRPATAPAPQRPTPEPTPKEPEVIPALVAALLPSLLEAAPKLFDIFKEGKVSEKNAKVADVVFEVAKTALNAANEQEVVERIKTDPEAAAVVKQAVEDNWFQLSEAGSGGIDGARKADLAVVASGDSVLKSPSFLMGMALLPLVYMIVGNLVGLFGKAEWSADARAGLAGAITGAIIGGLCGYYYGQTTSRNRTPSSS